jgi:hypothetical protein
MRRRCHLPHCRWPIAAKTRRTSGKNTAHGNLCAIKKMRPAVFEQYSAGFAPHTGDDIQTSIYPKKRRGYPVKMTKCLDAGFCSTILVTFSSPARRGIGTAYF